MVVSLFTGMGTMELKAEGEEVIDDAKVTIDYSKIPDIQVGETVLDYESYEEGEYDGPLQIFSIYALVYKDAAKSTGTNTNADTNSNSSGTEEDSSNLILEFKVHNSKKEGTLEDTVRASKE